ncbi:Uncharacterised protein [Actinobacillus equuli]|nr:Uncharacterised protein [Actinobacillus equuli]
MRRSASVVKTDIDNIDNQDQLDITQEEVIEPVAMPFQPEEKNHLSKNHKHQVIELKSIGNQ